MACPHVRRLEGFQAHRSGHVADRLWINANELPYRAHGYALDLAECHRYAGPIATSLAEAFARYARVTTDRLIATRGADEVIELLVRAFCRSGQDAIAHCQPTYCHYQVAARAHDVQIHEADLGAGYEIDHDALKRVPNNTKLVFLCNPNNPTGNLFMSRDIIAVARRFEGRALVVVDEAYIEFCPSSTVVPELEAFENLVVVRTMSKAFGLAGLHLGYAIAERTVIDALKRLIQPYPVPYPCAQIALQALSEPGLSRMRQCTRHVIETREHFAARLRSVPGVKRVLPSHTNFVLAEFESKNQVWQNMLRHGVVARLPEQPRLSSAIRFSIGTPAEMDTVLEILRGRSALHTGERGAVAGGD